MSKFRSCMGSSKLPPCLPNPSISVPPRAGPEVGAVLGGVNTQTFCSPIITSPGKKLESFKTYLR
jgi:hypothetical protein